jgi:hypothetical membrane protein
LLSLQVVPVELAVAFRWRRPYNFATDYISDLGNTGCRLVSRGGHRYVCSPWHQAMNASFIVFGGLLIIGSVLLWQAWPRRATTHWGLGLLCAGGAGGIVIGMSPENIDYWPHALAGFTQLPFLNVGMVLLGASVLGPHRHIGLASISAGGVGMVATVLYSSGAYGPLGSGIIERLAVDPIAVWLAIVGVWLLRRFLIGPWIRRRRSGRAGAAPVAG